MSSTLEEYFAELGASKFILVSDDASLPTPIELEKATSSFGDETMTRPCHHVAQTNQSRYDILQHRANTTTIIDAATHRWDSSPSSPLTQSKKSSSLSAGDEAKKSPTIGDVMLTLPRRRVSQESLPSSADRCLRIPIRGDGERWESGCVNRKTTFSGFTRNEDFSLHYQAIAQGHSDEYLELPKLLGLDGWMSGLHHDDSSSSSSSSTTSTRTALFLKKALEISMRLETTSSSSSLSTAASSIEA